MKPEKQQQIQISAAQSPASRA